MLRGWGLGPALAGRRALVGVTTSFFMSTEEKYPDPNKPAPLFVVAGPGIFPNKLSILPCNVVAVIVDREAAPDSPGR